jgi:hypothetical protein
MSQAEIKLIFRTADRNHDNKISFKEWGDFHALFITPFEEADRSGIYLLGKGDLDEMFR